MARDVDWNKLMIAIFEDRPSVRDLVAKLSPTDENARVDICDATFIGVGGIREATIDGEKVIILGPGVVE